MTRFSCLFSLALTASLTLVPLGARADVVSDTVKSYVLPRLDRVVASAAALDDAATKDCRPDSESLRVAFDQAYLDWVAVQHLNFGPVQKDNRYFAMVFWPDARNAVNRALRPLIGEANPIVNDPMAFRQSSVAGRGLSALELLLFGDEYPASDYTCALTRAITEDVEQTVREIRAGWTDYALTMIERGAENATYKSDAEVYRQFLTALDAGLEVDADLRLGRPLGTFDAPKPARAEAWRAGLSLPALSVSIASLRDLATSLSGGALDEDTRTEFDRVEAALDSVQDSPDLSLVADPAGRFRVEVLQQTIQTLRRVAAADVGDKLGVKAGFNSLDGD
ncbi:Imelysin [Aquimixticola soesokkakensis]|uniref:Imelysin n=1 Tax=Aquimixticola soesokkakensis TaxID=1519096 RepID=A0A1Y5TLH7_9RHOB|nr:imelysin family protein [Aquimixticola soesokkakensis]SLN66871.1 Imelysin [Aquimixticola soesokkakensis]